MKKIKGIIANKGKARGIARIIKNENDFSIFNEGDILVAPITDPSFVVIIIKASAIVSDKGGITSHPAIIAREFNIPCIVGVKDATKKIKSGDLIEVDAYNGIIKIF